MTILYSNNHVWPFQKCVVYTVCGSSNFTCKLINTTFPHLSSFGFYFHIQLQYCLVPRRLSLDENVRAKEGGKETPSVPFPWYLAVHHQPLAFRVRLYHAQNEAPKEEAGYSNGEKQRQPGYRVQARLAVAGNSQHFVTIQPRSLVLSPTFSLRKDE